MRHYINQLENNHQLLYVDREVDPKFELAAVTKKVQEQGDQAIRFNKIKGTDFPVVTNLYGSRKRLCDLIDAPMDGFCKNWTKLIEASKESTVAPTSLVDTPALVQGKLSDLPLITYHEVEEDQKYSSNRVVSGGR